MLTDAQKASLTALFPSGQVFTDLVSRLAYELDAAAFPGMPDAVVTLASAQDAQRLVQWADANRINIVARGAGTGLTGGAVASAGGIIASFARMKSVVQVDEDSRLAIVQPGVINQALQQRLAPLGLFYPPDPASYAVSTIGGNIAENAGGPHCLKYGVTSNYVLGLEVVLADGRRLWLGGQVVDPPEYDFTSLIVGSEGTLALITQSVLRLRKPAVGVKTLTASFADVAVAGQAVSAVIVAGLAPATIELMDHNMINIVEDYLALGLLRQAAALLIFDVEGYAESLDTQLDGVADILQRFTPLEVKIARTAEEREQLWLGRRNASGAVSRISPSEFILDVCVPRSRLAEALNEINAIAARYKLPTAYLAHAGDGNLHPGLLCDLSLEDDRRRVHLASDEILHYCTQIGGSIGGEHGVGIEKRAFMPAMYGAGELSAMQQVKQVFDPAGLFNPGKIFPAELDPVEHVSRLAVAIEGSGFEPLSPAELAAGLRSLQDSQQATRVVGRGQQWQGALEPGVPLSTRKLRGVLTLSAEDFYVTALAGTTFEELQATLIEQGFWFAAATPWPGVTLGGMAATNLNSPLRTMYGSLRDQVLAVQVALADGRLLRFGRPLVKDVAGYQMNKLFCGSYGALGVLTEITLKITSQPLARRTLVATVSETSQALRMGFTLLRLAANCSGIVLIAGNPEDTSAPGCCLYVTIEGHSADVRAELSVLQKALGGLGEPPLHETNPVPASQAWVECLARQRFSARVAVPPSEMPGLLNRLRAAGLGRNWVVDVANGILMLGDNSGDAGRAAQLLAESRGAAEAQAGYALMASGPRDWLGVIDAWGKPRPAHDLMRRLKLQWDPADILNRGEFV
jgi:D-lactate dehydrogenase (cytochrome)